MYFQNPAFDRKLSFGSLIDLSEKCEWPQGTVRPRVAIIGAGITGISTACHILDAGYDCHIFEAGGEESIGGIWQRVNRTSQLQIHSNFYKFHPAVEWKSDYPNRQEILGQVYKLWDRYDLDRRTTFECQVNSTYQEDDGKWVVNSSSEHGYFDGIVAAVGTCGEMFAPVIAGEANFKGKVLHSSELDREAVKGKNVLVVGGGASAVEALEFACDNDAASVKVLARSERWFLPRKPMLNAAMAGTIGDRWGILAWILEFLLKAFFYKDLWDMAPPSNGTDGIYNSTPIVNSRIFELIRQGRASWIRGDISHFVGNGLAFTRRAAGTKIGGPGAQTTEPGDVCILATGYRRPAMSFFPKLASTGTYRPPNWYLQTFPTENATICATNCTWKDGIGSVGGYHIGIYTRFLLVFLMDPRTRPSERMMKFWVDFVHHIKKPYAGGALAFVTSAELFFWFLVMIALQPSLWRWRKFILSGPELLGSKKETVSEVPEETPVQEIFHDTSERLDDEFEKLNMPLPTRQDSGIALEQMH